MADALSGSDWDLIKRVTGLTPANDKTGDWLDADGYAVSSGAAFEQAGAMVVGMADMRISAYKMGSPIIGNIAADQLRQDFQKYESAAADGTGPFTSTGWFRP